VNVVTVQQCCKAS